MPNNRERKRKRFEQNPFCHWCGVLTLWVKPEPGKCHPDDMATLDHLDDRFCEHRGKLRGSVRSVIACRKCNHERGQTRQAENVDLQRIMSQRRIRGASQARAMLNLESWAEQWQSRKDSEEPDNAER